MDVTAGDADREVKHIGGLTAWNAGGLAGESADGRANGGVGFWARDVARANGRTNIWTSNVAWAIGLCAGE
jgi:hypothetical protein